MTQWLVRKFISNPDDCKNGNVRTAYGRLSGIVGIVVNLLLCTLKAVIGMLTGSIAIAADAVNNLTDAAASIVTLVGFQIAHRPNDSKHPFGHGRMEYISALIIAAIILLVGVEFLKTSVSRILHPAPIMVSGTAMILLTCSIGAKAWLCYFYRYLGRKIDSSTMKASALDSISDVITTSVVVLSMLLSRLTSLSLDGWIGAIVAFIILYAGFNIARDTVNKLLGEGIDPALAHQIKASILKYDGILGVHDLIVHNYGPNRYMASIHAEVPSNVPIERSHAVVDRAEREVAQEFGVLLSIHMDPLVVDDVVSNRLREEVAALLFKLDPQIGMHDFRMVDVGDHINLLFDVEMPQHMTAEQGKQLYRTIQEQIPLLDSRYRCILTLDRSYEKPI